MTQRALNAEMGIQEVAHKVNCFFKDVPAFYVYAQNGGPCFPQSPVRADLSFSYNCRCWKTCSETVKQLNSQGGQKEKLSSRREIEKLRIEGKLRDQESFNCPEP